MEDAITVMAQGVTAVAVMAVIVAGLVAPLWLRMRDRARLYDLLRHTSERGEPISPELIGQVMSGPMPTGERDVRRGAILLAVAIGLGAPLAVFGRDIPPPILTTEAMLICVFGCLGVTFLLLGLLRRPGRD